MAFVGDVEDDEGGTDKSSWFPQLPEKKNTHQKLQSNFCAKDIYKTEECGHGKDVTVMRRQGCGMPCLFQGAKGLLVKHHYVTKSKYANQKPKQKPNNSVWKKISNRSK